MTNEGIEQERSAGTLGGSCAASITASEQATSLAQVHFTVLRFRPETGTPLA
jgi:hypothetical protein